MTEKQQLKRTSFINEYYPVLKISKVDVDSILVVVDHNKQSCEVVSPDKPLVVVNEHHVTCDNTMESNNETHADEKEHNGDENVDFNIEPIKSNNMTTQSLSSCKEETNQSDQFSGETTVQSVGCSSRIDKENFMMLTESNLKLLNSDNLNCLSFTPMEKKKKKKKESSSQKKSTQKKSPKSKGSNSKMDKILKKMAKITPLKKTPLNKLKENNSQSIDKSAKSKGAIKMDKILKKLAKKTPLKKNKENDPTKKKPKNETSTTKKNKEKKQSGNNKCEKKTPKGKEKLKKDGKIFTSVKKTSINKKKDSKNSKEKKNRDVEKEKEKNTQIICKVIKNRLDKLGVDKTRVSCCVKSAMSKGYITLTPAPSDLEQVIFDGKYESHHYKVFLKDIIYQPDVGSDYEDGNLKGGAICTCCPTHPTRAYVTQLCTGNAELNCGRFHNHCNKCSQFGQCVGDYREVHCKKCNSHYSFGVVGGTCYTCERRKCSRWVLKASVFPDQMLDELCYSNEELSGSA